MEKLIIEVKPAKGEPKVEEPSGWVIKDSKKREEILALLPSISDHAQLAALMVQGKSIESPDFTEAARQAIVLWNECIKEREKWIFLTALTERSRPIVAKVLKDKEIPVPKSFPVGIKEFTRLALPHVRVKDRVDIFSEFVRELLHCHNNPNGTSALNKVHIPTDQDCADWIKEYLHEGIVAELYSDLLSMLREFAIVYKKQKVDNHSKSAGDMSAASILLNKCPDITKDERQALRLKFPSIRLLLDANKEEFSALLNSKLKAKKLKTYLDNYRSAPK